MQLGKTGRNIKKVGYGTSYWYKGGIGKELQTTPSSEFKSEAQKEKPKNKRMRRHSLK